MMFRILSSGLCLSLFALNAQGGALDLMLNSEMAELVYLTENSTFGYGGADIGLGVLTNDNNDLFVNGSILVSGSGTGDVRALHFGVGGKLYAGELKLQPDNQDGGALAIGAMLRYVFPASTPLAVLAEGYWAPSVTSFSDFEGVSEFRVAVELEVTPSARAYIGYRKLVTVINNGTNYDVDDKADVGVRFAF
jgi:hypothetical protein